MKKLFFFAILSFIIVACGGGANKNADTSKSPSSDQVKDDGKGVGEIKNVALNNPLDEAMVNNGKAIYDLKCAACHKLSARRVVGPGFKGITEKRKPEWIMNMITNVEIMLDQDPEAQKLLEECLTRMPNQNVSVDEARDILEFLFKNDVAS